MPLAEVCFKQVCGVHSHRAVQKHWQRAWQLALALEQMNRVQQSLGSAHRKNRYHRHTTAFGVPLQRERLFGQAVFDWVNAVAVGGFDQHRVSLRCIVCRAHDQVVRATQIA